MSAAEMLILCAAVAGVVAIAIFATRWSLGKQDDYRRVVAASDGALAQAARTLGLQFVPGPVYDHPMMGRTPAFGQARGVLRGVSVRVSVANQELGGDPPTFRTELRAELGTQSRAQVLPVPDGHRFRLERAATSLVMVPNVAETGSVHVYRYRVLTDAGLLVDLLHELTALAGAV